MSDNRTIAARFQDTEAMTAALQAAREAAYRRHAAANVPIVVWQNGKVVELDPHVALARLLNDRIPTIEDPAI